jgi:iron complex outermembrane receptor protein
MAGAAVCAALAATAEADPQSLTRLSVEDLARIQVVTVSRRPETSLEAAGAVYAISPEEIRLSGGTAIPDVLRLSPGLQASVIDADEWALTIRGFASRLSRSILVRMDGRSVWTPLFAGVFWDAQDTMLDDVERIEVSRGPGGPLFGANAMNGVISVVTRSAADTQRGLVVAGLGNEEGFGSGRWGGRLGATTFYRGYAKYLERDGTRPLAGPGYDDTWRLGQAGFRVDASPLSGHRFTLQGDAYRGEAGQQATVATFTAPYSTVLTGDARFDGANAVARWSRPTSGRAELTAQLYYDHTSRDEVYFDEDRDTVDLDVQHRFPWASRHEAVVGAAYRLSHGRFAGPETLQILPPSRHDDIASLFAHDELRVMGGRLRLGLGAKLEWNDYSGWNVQPAARAAFVVRASHVVWASVTRAVRTTSRVEHDLLSYTSLSASAPLFARTSGSPDFEPESVLAFEAGYKGQPLRTVLVTVSAFQNEYHDLATSVAGSPVIEPTTPPRSVVPVRITNGPGGEVRGAEVRAVFSPAPAFRLQAAYTFLDQRLEAAPGAAAPPTNTPRHQLWMTGTAAAGDDLDLSLVFRQVGSIPGHRTPSFAELDARIAYRPWARLELAVVGRNLLHAAHPEFGGGFEVVRSAHARAALRF